MIFNSARIRFCKEDKLHLLLICMAIRGSVHHSIQTTTDEHLEPSFYQFVSLFIRNFEQLFNVLRAHVIQQLTQLFSKLSSRSLEIKNEKLELL